MYSAHDVSSGVWALVQFEEFTLAAVLVLHLSYGLLQGLYLPSDMCKIILQIIVLTDILLNGNLVLVCLRAHLLHLASHPSRMEYTYVCAEPVTYLCHLQSGGHIFAHQHIRLVCIPSFGHCSFLQVSIFAEPIISP